VYLVGLTGGIGSGKSTVAKRLMEHGCEVIDADQVARDVVAPGEPVLDDLVARFGRDILTPAGDLDRAALAGIAFADHLARGDLDRITHPRIAARIAERVAEIGAAPDAAPEQLVVVDHPLLFETGQAARFDAVVAVVASDDVRIERLKAERGMREVDARARMRAQTDDDTRRRGATHLIENDGTLHALLRAVDEVYDQLAEAAARSQPTGRS
jgi:dephospho-CoA kinase